jgi:hypothetical protein
MKGDSKMMSDTQIQVMRLRVEIAARDYRALKAVKLGVAINELYPGETDWYKGKVEELRALESAGPE